MDDCSVLLGFSALGKKTSIVFILSVYAWCLVTLERKLHLWPESSVLCSLAFQIAYLSISMHILPQDRKCLCFLRTSFLIRFPAHDQIFVFVSCRNRKKEHDYWYLKKTRSSPYNTPSVRVTRQRNHINVNILLSAS